MASQEPAFTKTDVAPVTDDDVIQNAHSKDLTGVRKTSRELAIISARGPLGWLCARIEYT